MSISFGSWALGLDGGDLPGKDLIGGKAWSIARMSTLGLKVPPAFVVTSRACKDYCSDGADVSEIEGEIAAGIAWLEARTGCSFGSGPRPLLVSVRSGGAVSMPGMMDTVLNVGITDSTEALLASQWSNPSFARNTHCRFLDLYARLVLNASPVRLSRGDDPAEWRRALGETGMLVPESTWEQLYATTRAVFRSWESRRARRYRSHHGLLDDGGTAVLVQAMVFGNLDEKSGTGVLFSRNPITGEPAPFGEFLPQAQGEDIVSGNVTPQPLTAMRTQLGGALEQLLAAARVLERADGDMQDIEFTVERGELFLLQARVGKRAAAAAARIAVDMVAEGIITPEVALTRVSPEQIRSTLRPQLPDGAVTGAQVLSRGEAASPGVGWGIVVNDPDEAERRASRGEDVVLARVTTSPDDLHGMIAARAVITEQGGSTSHAAVVGRALGRPSIVGCGQGMTDSLVGHLVTVDGNRGHIYDGRLLVTQPSEEDDRALQCLCRWAETQAPIRIESEAASADVLLDTDAASISTLDSLREALAKLSPGATVRGVLFAKESAAVKAAVEAGVKTIITKPRLPALLASITALDSFGHSSSGSQSANNLKKALS